jgi:hypothetical protein
MQAAHCALPNAAGFVVLHEDPVTAGLSEAVRVKGLRKISPLITNVTGSNQHDVRNCRRYEFHDSALASLIGFAAAEDESIKRLLWKSVLLSRE